MALNYCTLERQQKKVAHNLTSASCIFLLLQNTEQKEYYQRKCKRNKD